MKTFTREDLKTLMQPQAGWCVSLYMPTHRTAAGSHADQIELKNLLRQAAEQLRRKGVPDSEVAAQLDAAFCLLADNAFWRQPEDGLALFVSARALHTFQFPLAFEESIVVAHRFAIRPLLPLLHEAEAFYVLALSQNEARLLAGTRFGMTALSVEGLPHSMADALRFDELQKQMQYHTVSPSAGRGTVAIFHGQAAGIDDTKDRLVRYFRQVDDALCRTLPHTGAPLVVAAVDYLLPLYREVNTYPHLMDQYMAGNPEERSSADLHRAAWEIVAPRFQAAQEDALAAFRRYEGTARASNHIEEIVRAAYAGRVETLLAAAGAQRWGTYDEERDSVEVHAEAQPDDDELLDLAAMRVLLDGGAVYVMPSALMPHDLPAAAVFRY